jgi:hypothetical protein
VAIRRRKRRDEQHTSIYIYGQIYNILFAPRIDFVFVCSLSTILAPDSAAAGVFVQLIIIIIDIIVDNILIRLACIYNILCMKKVGHKTWFEGTFFARPEKNTLQ